jgi:iron complex transport system substrate-binding protein
MELSATSMSTHPRSPASPSSFPRRIVCLTDETTEILYRLKEQDRIVGISAYATRPPEARTKPRVSAFRDANLDKIINLKPDLVLAYSDVQAEITRQLVLRGMTVVHFNQRSIAEIFEMTAALARLVGKPAEGDALIAELALGLNAIRESAKGLARRPRVFFEEWPDPLVSGIEWVEELIEMAGGQVLFPELSKCGKAQDRVVEPDQVARRDPELILASWCGQKVSIDQICRRPGWSSTSAVGNGHVYEIDSGLILQPGPASLTEGAQQLHRMIARVAGGKLETGQALRPSFL